MGLYFERTDNRWLDLEVRVEKPVTEKVPEISSKDRALSILSNHDSLPSSAYQVRPHSFERAHNLSNRLASLPRIPYFPSNRDGNPREIARLRGRLTPHEIVIAKSIAVEPDTQVYQSMK